MKKNFCINICLFNLFLFFIANIAYATPNHDAIHISCTGIVSTYVGRYENQKYKTLDFYIDDKASILYAQNGNVIHGRINSFNSNIVSLSNVTLNNLEGSLSINRNIGTIQMNFENPYAGVFNKEYLFFFFFFSKVQPF